MPIDLNSKLLLQTITKVINHVENELRELNKGIFFAPELYLAFEVGKALYAERMNVFGKERIEWLRETNLGNGGPSDLIFKIGEEYIVFEFKISSTSYSYEKDIEKLKMLSNLKEFKGHRVFVALIDHFPGKGDARIEFLEKYPFKRINKESMKTYYSRYSGVVDCEIYCCETH